MKNGNDYHILVMGGGHAGLEAASVSSQFEGLKIGLISLPGLPLGETPCNPAVGGVGKGQVVREIDALGGLMGKVCDLSAIHYKTLNSSKGYAVQSTRAQVDKVLYSQFATEFIKSNDKIDLIEGKVETVEMVDGEGYSLSLSDGRSYRTSKLIVTAGTFLDGKMHFGESVEKGGMLGADSSNSLKNIFTECSMNSSRFKTGTPARLKSSTVDFSGMVVQSSDQDSISFHYAHYGVGRFQKQICCYLTKTNDETLSIIRNNKERSPLFNGQINGVGPRYCPSIEDKAFRYPDRNEHHIFVEPEGLEIGTVYPNGLSTSLPKDVQEDFIHSIKGFENAEFDKYGYAVEYDIIDSSTLSSHLEHLDHQGLYFAGQVNGTSGYEEAAGQGIVAGINASLSSVGQEQIKIDRHDSYIGVLIEDLVSSKRDEPYRLFTARSENRLYIREDNTVVRMGKYRKSLGLSLEIDNYQDDFLIQYNLLSELVDQQTLICNQSEKDHFLRMNYGPIDSNITLSELLKRSKLDPITVLSSELKRFGALFSTEVVRAVAISKKYEGYINRSNLENERYIRLGRRSISWESIVKSGNISTECKQRISAIRPETFSELQRIEGIRQATLAFVAGNCL